jgi:hypothetical protein
MSAQHLEEGGFSRAIDAGQSNLVLAADNGIQALKIYQAAGAEDQVLCEENIRFLREFSSPAP